MSLRPRVRAAPSVGPVLVALDVDRDADPALAVSIRNALGAHLVEPPAPAAGWRLHLTATQLELRRSAARRRPLVAQLVEGPAGARLLRAGTRTEALARAVGLGAGTTTVLDSTAGLGGDTILLAWLGARVTAVERSPIVAALLADGLRRAGLDPRFGPALAGRVTLVVGDARQVLEHASPPPDAVLLDPMFPRAGRTALGRGELQLLRELVGDDDDADELLAVARRVARRRVVVKRPARAPPLRGPAPDVVSRGQSTRFDIYLRPLPA